MLGWSEPPAVGIKRGSTLQSMSACSELGKPYLPLDIDLRI